MPEGIVEIQMPQMGESVTEGVILEWHKGEGEFVEEGETVVEVSTDKVDAEVPAPASGTITKLMAQPDDTVAVGQVLAQLDPNGKASGNGASADGAGQETGPGLTEGGTGEGDADLGEDDVPAESSTPGADETPAPAAAATAEGEAPAATAEGEPMQVVMPEMGESVTEGTVLEWHKQEGDAVEEGETVVEVSTDKVDAEVPAPASGTIVKHLVQPDDVVQVGQALAEMSAGAAPSDGFRATGPAAPGRGSSLEKPEAQAEGEGFQAGPEEAAGSDSNG